MTYMPEGWFPDPLNSNGMRWWDGQAWTQRIQNTTEAPAEDITLGAAEIATVALPSTNEKPTKPKRKLPAVLVVIILAVVVIVGAVFAIPAVLASNTRPAAAAVQVTPAPTATKSLAPVDSSNAISSAVGGINDLGLVDKAHQVAKAASDPVYPDCAAVIAAGKAPISIGSPGYTRALDPDGDGIGCD
ncbi:DUF2510 domain-containing protein (plasmid) [Glaciihabitans sp. INWT7]|uniref:excalibur calcium-binding domain-containing protein n=1 Tax=Glaciihabitans sp. INWT7 TaxID=2596912 RepID=UPI00162ACC41|nr:excalibur calcium-binding domain-containing protein [Glaciihabitans sp. INWT7]QNE48709.1 DUF2510 domain-containing protein [Glaciihabitans sp. INWT7]